MHGMHCDIVIYSCTCMFRDYELVGGGHNKKCLLDCYHSKLLLHTSSSVSKWYCLS